MEPEHLRVRPFVDTPVQDQVGARAAAEQVASEFSLGSVELVRVGMNAVFVCKDRILRVGRPTAPAEAALELAEMLRAASLQVPRPASDQVRVIGELTVTQWERVVPSGGRIDWVAVGEQIAQVHRLSPEDLPERYPCPSPVSFPWWQFDELLAETASVIDLAALEGLTEAVERHRWWWQQISSASTVVCHGDVHPGNLIQTESGPVLLDWDLLCRAPAGWDHAPMMTMAQRWGGLPGEYEAFARGYGRSLREDPFAEAIAELRLVAATLMRVRSGVHEATAAAEAQRRLAFWRGDPEAPMWTAQ
jgi:aminoglycoside phosphotransferase (APT) family kinase protein